MKRFLSVLCSILGNVLLCSVAVTMGFTVLLKGCHIDPMYVVSNSMTPTFSSGDIILVSTRHNAVAAGDVIAYKNTSGDMVTHRITSIDHNMVTTRGDANKSDDPMFPTSAIHGEVVGIIPHLGWVFRRVTVWSSLVVGIGLCILSNTLRPRLGRRFAKKSRNRPHHIAASE